MNILNIDLSDLNFLLNEDVYPLESKSTINTIVNNATTESYSAFFREYLVRNQPCIIKDGLSNWKSCEQWVSNGKPNFEFLESKFGHDEVPVSDCKTRFFNAHKMETQIFCNYIDYWKQYINDNYPENRPCWYLKDWHFMLNFPSESIYIVPYQFSSDWLNEFYVAHPSMNDDYRFVYMGPKKSWTPFHADVFTSFSWSANICGKKKWMLFPPGEEEYFRDEMGNIAYDVSVKNVGDSNSNKLNRSITIIQEPGELLFVPSGWYHQVWNEDDTISINHNWINACNITQVWNALELNLKAVKKEVADCQDMENWLEHCQLMLKSTFGMNFENFYQFLLYIGNKRIEHLNQNEPLEVFSSWKFGLEHLVYDLMKIRGVLLLFIDCDDLIELPFYLELDRPPEYFINDINDAISVYLSKAAASNLHE